MIVLDAVLPELEKAVDERIESQTLNRMDVDQLRDLVYKLVEDRRARDRDPSRHFDELVANAAERHGDLMQAREHSVQVRADLLAEILRRVKPALPALVGGIVVETEYRPRAHPQRRLHESLAGVELIDGEKEGPTGRDTMVRSGRSWWIVMPAEQGRQDLASYALLEHSGMIENGSGTTRSSLTLLAPKEAAERIRDDQFPKLMERLHKRLVSAAAKRVVKTTDSMWAIAESLKAALDAMRNA